MLTLASTGVGGDAWAGRPAPVTARIQVTARVLPSATLTVLHQERDLILSPDDVARGYVDAPGATKVKIRENSLGGYLLIFEEAGVRDSPVERVTVRGLGSDVEVGRGGGWIARPHGGGIDSAVLSYRFTLAPGARAGTYPWPFSLSVRPQ